MEQWIIDGFKDHQSKLWDLGNIKVLDFQKPGTSNWHIRFTFIEDMYTLCISGDLGYLVATNYSNMTYAEFFNAFGRSPGYFREKVKTHSMPFYEYDQDLAWENLLAEYKDEIEEHLLNAVGDTSDMDEDEVKEELDYVRSEWYDEIFEDFSDETGIGPHGTEILEDVIPDFWEIREYAGRKKTQWTDVYLYAFSEAKKRLPEKDKDNIERFREKIQKLADMLPDYGKREYEYDQILDDLIIKYKSVAYLCDRLKVYAKR